MSVDTATKGFAIKQALRLEKQLATTDADLFGGENSLVPIAGDLIPAETNVEFSGGSEYYTDASTNGTQFEGDKRKTAEMPSLAGLSVKCYTQGLERLLLASLGYASPAGPVAVASTTGFYAHLFCVPPQGRKQRGYTPAEESLVESGFSEADRINTYLAVSQELGPYERHLRNVVLKDIELGCTKGGPLTLKVSGPAERLVKDNSKASCTSWTCPAGAFGDWFQLTDCKLYIQPVTEAFTPLSKHVSITDLSIKLAHGLSESDQPTGTSNNGLSRAEPSPSGRSSITGEFGVYLHDKTLYEDWADNLTKLHAKLVFSRGNYQFTVLLPYVTVVLSDPNFDGAGSVKMSIASSLPTDPAALAAISTSFATERSLSGTAQPWPATSVLGLMVVSKESRNPMRWSL